MDRHLILRSLGKGIKFLGTSMAENPVLTLSAIAIPLGVASMVHHYVTNYGPYMLDSERNDLIRQNLRMQQQMLDNNAPKNDIIRQQRLIQPILM